MKANRARPVPALTERQIRNFWSYVDKRGPDECWPWLGHRKTRQNTPTYGSFKIHPHGDFLAHRVMWVLCGGKDVPEVMHDCDNPPCCNYAHLKAGDHDANMHDMSVKGRNDWAEDHPFRLDPSRLARGEEIGRAALTEEQVEQIRTMYTSGKYSHRELGERFGVAKGCIYHVLHGLTWKHVAPELITESAGKIRSLTPDQVIELRLLRKEGWTFKALGERFGLTIGAAFNVAKGVNYQDVAGNLDTSREPTTRKLTPRQIREIRRRFDAGDSRSQMAKDYEVCYGTIQAVGKRQIYKHIA